MYPPVILVVAAAFFAQYYMIYAVSYLKLPAYVAGHERMPFQARELMRYPLGWAMASPFLAHLTHGHKGSGTPAQLFTEVNAFVCLLLSGWAALKLYRWAEPQARVPLLPAAVLLIICLFDYGISVPYGFPYDLPSLAFLGWGTWFILTDQFWPLLLLFPFATWNRETSLFLVFLLAVVACFRTGRFTWRSVRRADLFRIACLGLLWALIVGALQRKYAANPTEAGSRVQANLHELMNPMHWPGLLSASAFLLPYIWLRRNCIRQPTLRAGVGLLPLWFLLLLSKGQILELRIYGDVSVLVAVAASVVLAASFAEPAAANGSLCEDARTGDSLKVS